MLIYDVPSIMYNIPYIIYPMPCTIYLIAILMDFCCLWALTMSLPRQRIGTIRDHRGLLGVYDRLLGLIRPYWDTKAPLDKLMCNIESRVFPSTNAPTVGRGSRVAVPSLPTISATIAESRDPTSQINMRIAHRGSKAQYKRGILEIVFCRIHMMIWSFGALETTALEGLFWNIGPRPRASPPASAQGPAGVLLAVQAPSSQGRPE